MAIRKNKKTNALTAYFQSENTIYKKAIKTHEEGEKWIQNKRKELNFSK